MESDDTAQMVLPVGRSGPPRQVRPYKVRAARSLSEQHQSHLTVVAETFHKTFTQWLQSRSRAEVAITMAPAQRWSWADLLAKLPDPYCGAPFDAAPLAGPGLITVSMPLASALVDRLLGGHGAAPEADPAPLTEVGLEVLNEFQQHTLAALAAALEVIVTFHPTVDRQGSRLELVKTARPSYGTVLLSFGVSVGDATGTVRIALPGEPIIAHLDAITGTTAAPVPTASLDRRLLDTPVELSVRFDPASFTPDAILGLAIGDVITIPHPIDRPLTVWVGEQPYLSAVAGRRGSQLAFAVADRPTGDHQ